jgi:hypothetical protein
MAESKVKDDNFFLVAGWMLNRLNLKGVALQVFSIIYGFSQDGEGSFTGSLQYLCDFTNASKNTILKALKELVDKGYVLKAENTINGVRFCTYKTNAPLVQKLHRGCAETEPPPSSETAPGGGAETEPNNISFNNKDKISKDIVNETINLYHTICVSFPTIRAVSEARKKAIHKMLGKYTLDDLKSVFENAEKSSFLKGVDGGWKASFDWLMKEDNFLKVMEGNYADKPKYGRKEIVPGWMQKRELGEDEKKAIQRMMQEGVPSDLAERADRLKQELQGGV